MSNYRPVSNLAYVSKLTETVVCNQLRSYLDMWDFQEEFQSAYRCNHSTETALLRIKHDFHKSFDSKSGTVLVLLDLKSAFDTVDHAIMLEGLHSNYAISGLALQWFRSYLADRHFNVCVRNETSDKCPLKYGVPQGSVLGPLLFTLYINPLVILLDDTMLNFTFTQMTFKCIIVLIQKVSIVCTMQYRCLKSVFPRLVSGWS